MGFPSSIRHFRRSEFSHPDRMDPVLLNLLDEVRERAGCPIKVISDYRSREHNEAIGGNPNSPHMRGAAVDIAPMPYTAENRMAVIFAALWLRHEGRWGRLGLGIYNGHVHLDNDQVLTRPHIWTGVSR